MKRATMSVRGHSGSQQKWGKSRMFVERRTGLRQASQVWFEEVCRQQS